MAAALVATLLPLTACSEEAPPPRWSGGGDAEQVALRIQDTLTARASALLDRRERAFRRLLDRSDTTFLAEQATYFANLRQLPVGELAIEVDPTTLTPVDGAEDYWAEVVVALRLDGYDATAVRSRDRYRFTPTGDGGGYLVASTTDPDWEADHPGNAQPWDIGAVEVHQDAGVLGIFDADSVHAADRLLALAAVGRYDVRGVIGAAATVSSGVVVHAVGDPTFLRGLSDRTVGDGDRVDGLTVAVPSDAADPTAATASYRVFLDPRVLSQPDVVLGRLVRHELTHATLGDRGAGSPLWLTEGVAEYVSVRAIPADRRRLPARALEVGATASELPGTEEFAGSDAEAWYGVSWWVCEYVAATFGAEALLQLLDAMAGGAAPDAVLASMLGLTGPELVRRGAALMSTTYAD